jgi:hypothetical protein
MRRHRPAVHRDEHLRLRRPDQRERPRDLLGPDDPAPFGSFDGADDAVPVRHDIHRGRPLGLAPAERARPDLLLAHHDEQPDPPEGAAGPEPHGRDERERDAPLAPRPAARPLPRDHPVAAHRPRRRLPPRGVDLPGAGAPHHPCPLAQGHADGPHRAAHAAPAAPRPDDERALFALQDRGDQGAAGLRRLARTFSRSSTPSRTTPQTPR